MSKSSESAANFRTLYHSQIRSGAASGYALFLIRESESWARHWSVINAGSGPVSPPPLVDFAHETVISLSIGDRPVLFYDVTIEDVTVREMTLVVTGVERRPVSAATLDMACSPMHVVAARLGRHTIEDMLLNLRIKPAEAHRVGPLALPQFPDWPYPVIVMIGNALDVDPDYLRQAYLKATPDSTTLQPLDDSRTRAAEDEETLQQLMSQILAADDNPLPSADESIPATSQPRPEPVAPASGPVDHAEGSPGPHPRQEVPLQGKTPPRKLT